MKATKLVAVILLLFCTAIAPPPAYAVQPDEVLSNPLLEERAREIGKGLRCLVCQNQSIDDSNADLARDLRILVRQRLQAGDSNAEVMAYVQARYGDFVLLRPPVRPATWALWLGPPAIMLIGAIFVFVFLRRRSGRTPEVPAELTAVERARLAEIMDAPGEADSGPRA